MANNSLFPSFFRVFYDTAFASHVMTIPTRLWDDSGGDAGSFLNWVSGDDDAITMIGGFVDLLLPFHVSTTTFHQAIIYTMDDEEAPPRPRGFVSFTGKDGTHIGTATPAAQSMYTFRSTNFGLLKYLFFDAPVTDGFVPFNDIADSAALEDLFDYVSDTSHAFAARDNGRPAQFVRATFKLNDELRHQYRLD